ncbi:hypothetical protein M752DRAFT_290058 [Aspergillus phoenicis ATCC 13157]|uniref:General substrate transporter n=1 Tax=Aspergillus phoenicis ATCC 13157 TaxID=1353007 RepID=A0A370PWJ0_ASPPH|nr:hypothetical protein M752DRAFT_290058 [Aspergillus phoenicis ATCC 13157]
MVFTTAAITNIEKIGRKRLMLRGALGQGTCFILITMGLAVGGSKWSAVAIAFVFAFYTVFGLSWIAIPWMYAAEVDTRPWRNRGSGLATATNWICNYAVVLVTPIGTENIDWQYYIIYAVLNFCFIPVVSLWYVETAGLSLEEIDAVFQRQNAPYPPGMPESGIEADQGNSEWEQGQSEWVESIDSRRQDRGSVGGIRSS